MENVYPRGFRVINIELIYYFLCHVRQVVSFSILPVSNFVRAEPLARLFRDLSFGLRLYNKIDYS